MPGQLTTDRSAGGLPTPRTKQSAPAVWWLIVVLATMVALYAMAYVVVGVPMYPRELRDSFISRPWGIYPHAFFGSLAMLLGPFQFRRDLLRRRRPLHRKLGKIYVASCLIAGVAGLYMAAYSFGGWVTHLGFGGLALGLIVTTYRALAAVRRGDIVRHREWMIRSYALIFAAVTLRLQLPLFTMAAGGFAAAYMIVSWLSWVPNLLWAEWYLRASSSREAPLVRRLGTA